MRNGITKYGSWRKEKGFNGESHLLKIYHSSVYSEVPSYLLPSCETKLHS